MQQAENSPVISQLLTQQQPTHIHPKKMLKFAACVALASGALGASVPVSYAPAPTYAPAPLQYSFGYGVKDDYVSPGPITDLRFGHDEVAEPTVVNGCYSVLLPDGRTQTVR